MGYDAVAKEGVMLAAAGAVKELVRRDHIARPQLLLQAAHSSDGDDPAHIEGAQRPDVGAVVQFRGKDAMAARMAGQEVNPPAGEGSANDPVGRRTIRRV